jgi:hypothetical protein
MVYTMKPQMNCSETILKMQEKIRKDRNSNSSYVHWCLSFDMLLSCNQEDNVPVIHSSVRTSRFSKRNHRQMRSEH